MKKILFIIISVLLLTTLSLTAFAHSGGTDSNGGHYDRQNGGYHYHHGYPAHSHPNGECPYKNGSIEDNSDSKNNQFNLLNWLFAIAILSPFTLLLQSFILLLILNKYFALIDVFSSPFIIKIWTVSIIITIQLSIIWDYFSSISWAWFTLIIPEVIFLTIIIIPLIKKIKYYKTFIGMSYLQIFNKVNQTNINCEFDEKLLPIGNNKSMGIYDEYTCYVSLTGKCKHFKHNCCNATIEKHIFETMQYSNCSKCQKYKTETLVSETQYLQFLNVVNDLKSIKYIK